MSPRGRLGGSVLAAVLALGGCTRTAQPIVTTPATPAAEAPTPLPDVFVQVVGAAATEDQAYALAERALAEALLGDEAWAALVGLTVHRRGVDPQRVDSTADGVEVRLGLTRTQAIGVLSSFENAEPEASGPQAWRESLLAAYQAHVAAHACRRRGELFGSQCEPVATDDADQMLARLRDGLALDPVHRYGVPADADGHPLRDPAVYVFWGGVPMADVPVVVEGPPEAGSSPQHLRSDVSGRATIEGVTDAGAFPLRVRIDADALLGPLRELAPRAETTLEPVAVGWDRWAMVVERERDGLQRSDATMSGLLDGMRKAGHGAPMQLTVAQSEPLLARDDATRVEAASALGDAYAGRLDVVLLLRYESRFASRMGGNRVWYEAEGSLEARSVWTGRVLARAEAKVEADGVGDERAEKAARRELGATLVQQVLADRDRS
ncbi:MAG: hypothetical protein AB1Z98_04890 [Nannocystaceae bacterium]